MIDERKRFERAFELFPMPEPSLDRLIRRRDRKRRNQRLAAGVLGVAIFALIAVSVGIQLRSDPKAEGSQTPDKFADVHGWIVYRSSTEIVAVDPANPQDTVALGPSFRADPVGWSQDGTRLLLSHPQWSLILEHADGSRSYLHPGLVVHENGDRVYWHAGGGSFSPDGSMITYGLAGRGGGVFVIDADGITPRLVVRADSPGPCGQSAAWSPDGSRIAFTDFRGPYGPTCHRSPYGLSFVNADGTRLQEQLVHLPLGVGPDGLAWSPDGSQLVLSATVYEGDTLRWRIYVLNADGTGLRQISSRENDRWPAWSPDGTRIAFVRGHQLFTMASDGTDVQEVEGASPEGSIAWNPLG